MLNVSLSQTSISIEDGGAVATIPAATPRQAGVMPARYAQMLEAVYARVNGGSAPALAQSPIIIEAAPAPAIDTSEFVRRADLAAAVAAIPRPTDVTPALAALNGRVDRIAADVLKAAALAVVPSDEYVTRAEFETMLRSQQALVAEVDTLRRVLDAVLDRTIINSVSVA